jgi:RecA-family ATPase
LQMMIEAFDAQFVIIDGASDTFDGNEIARREVRAFIKLLRRVHRHRSIGVLLNVHIDRSSARGHSTNDDGYAGSAQWHNSCRRRMFLQVKAEKDEEGAVISEAFLLRVMKNQDGPPDPDMELMRAQHGLWQIAVTFGGNLAQKDETDHGTTLLKLIADHYQGGIFMSTSLAPQASTGVYATLKGAPGFPRGLTRKRVEALVRQLERDGLLVREDYKRGNRAMGERWAVAGGPGDAN